MYKFQVPYYIGVSSCKTAKNITDNGGLVDINPSDGVVSVYSRYENSYRPQILTKECCETLGIGASFDIKTQSCKVPTTNSCAIEDTFKLTLNPRGTDGAFFYEDINNTETCSLLVEFDYLFKFKAETFIQAANTSSIEDVTPIITDLLNKLQEQSVICEKLTNDYNALEYQVQNTPYSIFCLPEDMNYSSLYCLTSDGLSVWLTILGQTKYNDFINGDINSYSCDDLYELLSREETSGQYVYVCNIPFGTKTNLIKQLVELNNDLAQCSSIISILSTQINELQNNDITPLAPVCVSPLNTLQTFNASVSVNIISGTTTGNKLVSVYDNEFFPSVNNLYDYLVNTGENSGFFMCGDPTGSEIGIFSACTPLNLFNTSANVTSSNMVLQPLLTDLFTQSTLSDYYSDFIPTLSTNSLNSSWLKYSTEITDQTIIQQLINQKITLSITIGNSCSNFCVLVDNIKLIKNCTKTKKNILNIDKSPGFELDRIRDNKKSWVSNDTRVEREFDLPIRLTDYFVNDERLVINSKEIDLNINMASAIETDIWCYINDNPCILSGISNCDPCNLPIKQFQDETCFYFMDDYPYEFMDSSATTENLDCGCCGDNKIDFDSLFTQPLTNIKVVEDFEYLVSSQLVDVKNRQTISAYPTIRALYDRYKNSSSYCDTTSSAFDYETMNKLADRVGFYWTDVVEQVMPATTIWGSTRVYGNNIFDEQKFKYKAYTTFFDVNPFLNNVISNPINGTSGESQTVDVTLTILPSQVANGPTITPVVNKATSIKIAQMNMGSEFIGKILIQ